MIIPTEATNITATTAPSTGADGAQQRRGEENSNIDTFFEKAIDKIKTYEGQLQEKFASTSDGSNALMRMPEYMIEEFRRLESAAQTPEERAVVDRFKKGVTETFEANREYFINQFNSKIDSAEMKLGAQFVTKSVQGVQQLLSAT